MKQKYIAQKQTENEKGDKIYLFYFVTEGEDGFGAGIDMYTQSANRRTAKEQKCTKNLFRSREEASRFVNTLASGLVTPLTLSDIVEDKIFEKIEKNTCIS